MEDTFKFINSAKDCSVNVLNETNTEFKCQFCESSLF